jgi:hypothetical protein
MCDRLCVVKERSWQVVRSMKMVVGCQCNTSSQKNYDWHHASLKCDEIKYLKLYDGVIV